MTRIDRETIAIANVVIPNEKSAVRTQRQVRMGLIASERDNDVIFGSNGRHSGSRINGQQCGQPKRGKYRGCLSALQKLASHVVYGLAASGLCPVVRVSRFRCKLVIQSQK